MSRPNPRAVDELCAGELAAADVDPDVREAAVARLTAQGLTLDQIGDRIRLAPRSVGRIRARLGIAQRVGANQFTRATAARRVT